MAEREKRVIRQPKVRFYQETQKRVCPAHTDMITHTHARSLKRNEDKGLWRPWLAASFVKTQLLYRHMHANKMLWTKNKTSVEPDGKENRDEIKDEMNEKAGSYQPAGLVRATGAWLMSWCSRSARWPHQRVGGTATRHYEHFHTHTARLPPKNM